MRRNPEGPFYAMATLLVEDVRVWMFHRTNWVEGWMTKKSGKRTYWVAGTIASTELKPRDIPDKWCPIDRATWVHPLPKPLEGELYWPGNYSEPGQLTIKEVEIRVCRALWTSRQVVRPEGWEPDNRDRKDEINACRWHLKLSDEDQQLAAARAADISFKLIGEERGISGQAARNQYERMLSRLVSVANAVEAKRRA